MSTLAPLMNTVGLYPECLFPVLCLYYSRAFPSYEDMWASSGSISDLLKPVIREISPARASMNWFMVFV